MKISTRKRLAALVTMGAMLVGMLAGCGGSSSAPSGTTGGGTATEAAAGQTTAGQTTAARQRQQAMPRANRKSTYGIILELRVYRWNSRNGWMSIMPRATRPS